jgi:hypothetical protein
VQEDGVDETAITRLKSLAKQITNARARETAKEKHLQRDYRVTGGSEEFSVFVRQSSLIRESFSAGLVWHAPNGQKIILARYNGSDHPHLNHIEGSRVDFTCHIHTATARYIDAGRKPEHFAEQTTRFRDAEGALHCLLLDWNITGLEVSPQVQLL